MKLYLDKKIESIPVFRDLLILLNGLSDVYIGSQLNEVSDISSMNKLIDPVRDFVDYYLDGSNQVYPEARIQYIINALYKAKGAPKIFDIMDEVFQVHIDYVYDFPVLEIIEFRGLKLTNVELFISKFTTMIYYLIYYTELNIALKQIVLSLQGNLIKYTSNTVVGYNFYKITDINYGLQSQSRL